MCARAPREHALNHTPAWMGGGRGGSKTLLLKVKVVNVSRHSCLHVNHLVFNKVPKTQQPLNFLSS